MQGFFADAHRRVIAVALVVGVVIVGLVVWLAVRPVPPVAGGDLAQIDSLTPDIATPPSGWSAPIGVPVTAGSFLQVMDTGVDGIVIGASMDVISAVDLNTRRTLWSAPGYSYLATLDGGVGVIVSDASEFYYVDLRTGQKTAIGTIPASEAVYFTDGTMVISDPTGVNPGDADNYCARKLGGSPDCLWQSWSSRLLGSIPDVFGGGRWINTADGIYDIAAGKLASFGASENLALDADSIVYFAGPADDVARITQARDGSNAVVVQAWDTATDQGRADPVTLTGSINWDSFDGPALLVFDGASTSLAAYSWATGQLAWQSQVGPVIDYGWSVAYYQNYLEMRWRTENADYTDGPDQYAILNLQTGQVLWQGESRYIVAAGQRVVYAANSETGEVSNPLTAFDATAAGVPQLWSLPAPAADVTYQGVANHIIAVSASAGQLWVLEP